MKKLFLFIFCFVLSSIVYAQNKLKEGDICTPNPKESYFPVKDKTKTIAWGSSYYVESKIRKVIIRGKWYTQYDQVWEDGSVGTLYLREEDGVTYEYNYRNGEILVRYDYRFKDGHKWSSKDGKTTYQIVSRKGKFKTPHCKYKDLLVIKAETIFGTHLYYYSKGLGYVGATGKKKSLFSYLTYNEE